MSDRDLVRDHVRRLVEAADAGGIPRDVLGRHLLSELTALWLQTRTPEDVAHELSFTAESLDPDQDFEFMRP
ncbi:MAG: hypothetical protein ACQGVC_05715 [Myxococcota bacterium]